MRCFIILIVVLILSSCKTNSNKVDLSNLVVNGDFKKAEEILKKRIDRADIGSNDRRDLEIELETLYRIRKEFPYNREEIRTQIKKYYPNLTDDQLDKWEISKQLEMRVIDGEKYYFKRAVSNFFRLNNEGKRLKAAIDGIPYDGVEDFQQEVIPAYFKNEIKPVEPFDLQKIKVVYTIRLKPNHVPDGKTVRCWLPYPRSGLNRLPNVEFIKASEKDFIIAPDKALQRTVYMEKQAVENKETVFRISYVFYAAAQWFNIQPEMVHPYNKSSDLYKKYTIERQPHIIFSEEVVGLAKTIVGTETNPVKQVEKLYYWMDANLPWTGALEYSVMPCIPGYVLENKRGDCGMKTFLFLSMARSLGIPCKWQSGWYLLPQEKNLHDWAEVYYEGVGWVPVDPSFQLIKSDDRRVKEFYLNGLDSYRLVINDDYAQQLHPTKEYYRSEPLDFQRGELEWEGGNLYFDTWSYNMEVEYLNE